MWFGYFYCWQNTLVYKESLGTIFWITEWVHWDTSNVLSLLLLSDYNIKGWLFFYCNILITLYLHVKTISRVELFFFLKEINFSFQKDIRRSTFYRLPIQNSQRFRKKLWNTIYIYIFIILSFSYNITIGDGLETFWFEKKL